MTKKIKILHILWSGKSGGAERFVRDITLYSDRSRFEHIVVFLNRGGWLADDIEKNGSRVYRLGMKSGLSVIRGLKLVSLLRRLKPFIVNNHVRNFFANFILKLTFRGPKVYFEHGGNLIGSNPIKEKVFYKIFGPMYNLILANSNYVKIRIIEANKYLRDSVKVFYIGINLDKYKRYSDKALIRNEFKIPENSKIVGMVGRLVEAKGVDDFIKTARLIKDRYERVSFIVVGDGPLRIDLDKIAREAGLPIHFLGDRTDVPRLLSMFDVFMFTSKWESFGIALLEALACKIPVVGFSVGGAKEILGQGGGILLDERDCGKLADIIIELLSTSSKSKLISTAGYANVYRNFNITTNIKKLDDLYSDLLISRKK